MSWYIVRLVYRPVGISSADRAKVLENTEKLNNKMKNGHLQNFNILGVPLRNY